tara:strand:- start:753 stop:1079 length:327 start_codon:yes stop_codon:yes gene_type:complete
MKENKKVSIVFKCNEKDSADLKVRLRYDKLQQTEFFNEIIKRYINHDPAILNVVLKIKEEKKKMGKIKLNKTQKDYQAASTILEDLGITRKDKEDIFDLIESSLEEYE